MAQGEIINWALGQWNSNCPLNVALGIGGLGSVADASHIEPGVVEIHLVNRGRTILHIEDNTGTYNVPQRAGDVTLVKATMYCQRERYSAFSEFCIKWGIHPGELIKPTEKFYKEDSS